MNSNKAESINAIKGNINNENSSKTEIKKENSSKENSDKMNPNTELIIKSNGKLYNSDYGNLSYILDNKHEPDFNQMLKVLRREKPDRPVLFEIFLNESIYSKLAGTDLKSVDPSDKVKYYSVIFNAFCNAGYDYATVHGMGSMFENQRGKNKPAEAKTISINDGAVIEDYTSFKDYKWPDIDAYDFSHLDKVRKVLPEGMKLMVMGPNGVLENTIALVGYERLCYMIIDDPGLAEGIFENVGKRLLRYYEICSGYDSVGMVMSNDDWGFKGQTMLSVADMRKYVFPWHKRIVEAIHEAGKPALLHSCGDLSRVMDDIIDDMCFDAKHSYEDNIMPVEEAYELWGNRIAVFGGIDVDFICRASREDIYRRSTEMLDRVSARGGYALGSGNSIPWYMPEENYLTMISAAHNYR